MLLSRLKSLTPVQAHTSREVPDYKVAGSRSSLLLNAKIAERYLCNPGFRCPVNRHLVCCHDAFSNNAELEALRKVVPAVRTATFLAFWSQLGLSLVSAGILLFSVAFSPQSGGMDPIKWCTAIGIAFSFVSTFFAEGLNRIARKVSEGGEAKVSFLVGNLLTNNVINLLGIGSAVVGLQASVGTLVAKSMLVSAQNPYAAGAAGAPPLISLDIWSLQATSNTLLAHFVSLIFTNFLLRVVNRQPNYT